MGHSMHGMMALEYTRRFPERVAGVVMIGSPPVGLLANAEEKLADLTVHVFEKSGHTPQLEQPAEFDRVLLEWLNK
jgi:pimeloyl-ACP methyl ester carboxylesterase